MKKQIPVLIRNMLVSGKVLTVACVNGDEDAEYLRKNPDCADIVEWRADKSCSITVLLLMEWLKKIGKPVILTPRSHYEGGACPHWTFTDRKRVFRAFMRLATLGLDIEVNDAPFFTDIIDEARAMGLIIFFSYHSLDKYPGEKNILFAFQNFKAFSKGDVFKLAIHIETTKQLGTCTKHVKRFNAEAPGCIAAMATGKRRGKSVRMEYALKRLTNVVYCFLTGSIVPGQYQIEEFKSEFVRLAA